jgi:hypothetical protein
MCRSPANFNWYRVFWALLAWPDQYAQADRRYSTLRRRDTQNRATSMTPMSAAFIKMGETDQVYFSPTGHSGDTVVFSVPFATTASDPEPFPLGAPVRIIVTPSDRYTRGLDRAFPVAAVWRADSAGFKLSARNSDTSGKGGWASFFWLAIAEIRRTSPVGIPLNQTFIGQPANFAATGTIGDPTLPDHQSLPNIYNLAFGDNQPFPLNNPPYSFVQTIAGTTFSTFGTSPFALNARPPSSPPRPLVFVTANNVGCGVGPYQHPAYNAGAIALVADNGRSSLITPEGFRLIARNSGAAGACGFNWVAIVETIASSLLAPAPPPPGAVPPVNLAVDSGIVSGLTASAVGFFFSQADTPGDWASAEVQFAGPFDAEPVVLVTPQFPDSQPLPNPPLRSSSCAPVGMVQNVTRFGFTLAAINTDNNPAGGAASFYWVAFGRQTYAGP